MSRIKKIAIIGANGTLGPHVLQALLSEPSFDVSVLSRASSKSKYADDIVNIHIPDSFPHAILVETLRPFDALVITFFGTERDNSIKLADACWEAGVRHIIPADYGSCDSSDPRSLSLIPLYQNKKDVRDHLEQLAQRPREDGSSLAWTSLITGHFFDYGLRNGLLSVDVKGRKARVYDGGEIRFALSSLASIGRAVVEVLKRADDGGVRNKLVYVREVAVTQKQMLKAVEDVLGEKLEVEQCGSDEYVKDCKERLAQKGGKDPHITEELVSVEGIVNTDWDKKGDRFVNGLLGLKEGDFGEMVKKELS